MQESLDASATMMDVLWCGGQISISIIILVDVEGLAHSVHRWPILAANNRSLQHFGNNSAPFIIYYTVLDILVFVDRRASHYNISVTIVLYSLQHISYHNYRTFFRGQESLDAFTTKIDDVGSDGQITWPEVLDALAEMVLGDAEADPADLKVTEGPRVYGMGVGALSPRSYQTRLSKSFAPRVLGLGFSV